MAASRSSASPSSDVARDPLDKIVEVLWERSRGDLASRGVSIIPSQVVVTHPDDVEKVLSQSHRSIGKGRSWDAFRAAAGSGLISTEPEQWQRQRRALQPVFLRRYHERFAHEIGRGLAQTLEIWEQKAQAGEPVAVSSEMASLTLRNADHILFDSELGESQRALSENMAFAMDYLRNWSAYSVWKRSLGAWVPGTRHARFRHAVSQMEAQASHLLQRRRECRKREKNERQGQTEAGENLNASDAPSLLDALLDELERPATPGEDRRWRQRGAARYLRDELMTFLFTSHDTTATAVAWAWWMLARNPEVEERLVNELKRELNGSAPTMADLPRLNFLDRVVKESLRLYPPIWLLMRETRGELQLRDGTLPPRTVIAVSSLLVNRHPDFWSNPDACDPDRFLAERGEGQHRYAYIPFGGGPRLCLGRQTALIEAKLIIGTLAQKFALRALPGVKIVPYLGITLSPSNRLLMQVEKR